MEGEQMVGGHDYPTWEYRSAAEFDQTQLNELGSAGWELVGVASGTFYFKRPRLSFRERVTLEQKERYYALWNVRAGASEAGA
jgi:hypothetical protein